MRTCVTTPVKVSPGYESTVNDTFWPSFTLPMSASGTVAAGDKDRTYTYAGGLIDILKQDAYFVYDHENLYRYFGKFRNPTDAKARWRGWLRAGEWM